ncbi:MAG: hypothetical protein M4579_004495 [Chaenotheca gracillima]|nr:MAG: hypothetical protein M4579_004495 [Chaenotheca gracillima]
MDAEKADASAAKDVAVSRDTTPRSYSQTSSSKQSKSERKYDPNTGLEVKQHQRTGSSTARGSKEKRSLGQRWRRWVSSDEKMGEGFGSYSSKGSWNVQGVPLSDYGFGRRKK